MIRLINPHSLRYQLLSRSLMILAALLFIVGISQYLFMQHFIYQNKAESIQSQVLSIPRVVWEFFDIGNRRSGLNRTPMLFFPDASVSFLNADGTFVTLSRDSQITNIPELSNEEYARVVDDHRPQEPIYNVLKDESGQQLLVVLQAIQDRGRIIGVAQITMRTAPLDAELNRQLLLFLILSMIALVAGLFTFKSTLQRTLVPLQRMVGKVERMNSGNLNERLEIEVSQSEMERLSLAFNQMLQRLETSFMAEKEAREQMRRFIADASHELRTPLTSIHGFLEILQRGAAENPEQLRIALKSMHLESARLNKLVHDLLLLAKLDQKPAAVLTAANLIEVVTEMEPNLRVLSGERSLVLELQPVENCQIDIDKIKQVILNLFQNAVQHTDPIKGKICIQTSESEHEVMLTVQDNGAGIAEEHLPRLSERFYRIDSSRARKSGGAGLGLAITQSILDLHQGNLRIESKLNKGSLFTISLPKQNLAEAR